MKNDKPHNRVNNVPFQLLTARQHQGKHELKCFHLWKALKGFHCNKSFLLPKSQNKVSLKKVLILKVITSGALHRGLYYHSASIRISFSMLLRRLPRQEETVATKDLKSNYMKICPFKVLGGSAQEPSQDTQELTYEDTVCFLVQAHTLIRKIDFHTQNKF